MSYPLIDLDKALPAAGFVREQKLLAMYGQHGPLPFSRSTLWRMIRAKKFPAPVKLSPGVTAWDVTSVRAWLQAQVQSQAQAQCAPDRTKAKRKATTNGIQGGL